MLSHCTKSKSTFLAKTLGSGALCALPADSSWTTLPAEQAQSSQAELVPGLGPGISFHCRACIPLASRFIMRPFLLAFLPTQWGFSVSALAGSPSLGVSAYGCFVRNSPLLCLLCCPALRGQGCYVTLHPRSPLHGMFNTSLLRVDGKVSGGGRSHAHQRGEASVLSPLGRVWCQDPHADVPGGQVRSARSSSV